MGGKKQGGAGARPGMGPPGPAVAGPRTASAGPQILAKILGPQEALNNASFDQTRETAANAVGTVASIVSNIFYPGTGGLAGMAANRTVREQMNTFGGRPFFESTEEPTKDWASLLIGTVAGYAGGAAGGALGGVVGGGTDVATQVGFTSAEAATGAAQVGGGVGGLTSAGTSTGAAIGGGLGSRIGGYLGGYAGGLVKRSLYGGNLPPSKYKPDPYKRTYIYGR